MAIVEIVKIVFTLGSGGPNHPRFLFNPVFGKSLFCQNDTSGKPVVVSSLIRRIEGRQAEAKYGVMRGFMRTDPPGV